MCRQVHLQIHWKVPPDSNFAQGVVGYYGELLLGCSCIFRGGGGNCSHSKSVCVSLSLGFLLLKSPLQAEFHRAPREPTALGLSFWISLIILYFIWSALSNLIFLVSVCSNPDPSNHLTHSASVYIRWITIFLLDGFTNLGPIKCIYFNLRCLLLCGWMLLPSQDSCGFTLPFAGPEETQHFLGLGVAKLIQVF